MLSFFSARNLKVVKMKALQSETSASDVINELYDTDCTIDTSFLGENTMETSILVEDNDETEMSTHELTENKRKRTSENSEVLSNAKRPKTGNLKTKGSAVGLSATAEHKNRKCSAKMELKCQIMRLKADVELLTKVKKYRTSSKMDSLIEKWRENGRMAASHLFNDAKIKVERMGGMEEFQLRQKREKKRQRQFEFDESKIYELEEFMESEEYEALDKYDKKDVQDQKCQLEEMRCALELSESEEELGPSEFTMKTLFDQMKMNMDLFF